MYKYKRIRLTNGTTRDEHRLVVEESIGRRLDKREVVHHINGDKTDNHIENLEIMSISEHAKFHLTGRIPSLEQLNRLKLMRERPNYERRKFSDEDVEFIKKSALSSRKLGVMFGVAHTSIADIRRGVTYKKYE